MRVDSSRLSLLSGRQLLDKLRRRSDGRFVVRDELTGGLLAFRVAEEKATGTEMMPEEADLIFGVSPLLVQADEHGGKIVDRTEHVQSG